MLGDGRGGSRKGAERGGGRGREGGAKEGGGARRRHWIFVGHTCTESLGDIR